MATRIASPHEAIKSFAYDTLRRFRPLEPASPDEATTTTLREFLHDVSTGVKDSPRMTPGVSDEVVPRGTATVAGWLKELGSFSRLAVETPAGASGRRVMYYKLTTGAKTIYTIFVVLPDGRIGDFDFTRD